MGRLLGIDYGSKRIGLAISDPDEIIATPMEILKGSGSVAADARNISKIAEANLVTELVVGLPLNMDGTEGDQAHLTRMMGRKLARVSALPVHFFDERLTSYAADQVLRRADMDREARRARRDKVAAGIILQAFIDSRRQKAESDRAEATESPDQPDAPADS